MDNIFRKITERLGILSESLWHLGRRQSIKNCHLIKTKEQNLHWKDDMAQCYVLAQTSLFRYSFTEI